MMNRQAYDVAIIGAGPAGSSLAYSLGKAGINVCLIDKEQFPRKKVCAGGLPPKIIDIMPFDIDHLFENDILKVSFSHKLNKLFEREADRTLIYTVNREKFDDYLLNQAINAGIDFSPAQKIRSIVFEDESWTVQFDNHEIKAAIIVGADGANSFVAKNIGLATIDNRHVAIQAEISSENLQNLYKNKVAIDWGYLKDGYAWLFPNGASVSIGVMGPANQGREVKAYFDKWVGSLGLELKKCKIRAHNIPHRITKRAISKEKALLIGDAAGLTDYWTGEGIYYAIRSAQIAASQIMKYLKHDTTALEDYDNIINSEILSELKASHTFSKLLNQASFLIIRAFRYDYPWDIFCRIMRGERSLLEVKKRLRPDIFLMKTFLKNKRNS